MNDDQRIVQLEKLVADLTYELYLLAFSVQSVCGTDKTDRLAAFHKETSAKLFEPKEDGSER